MVPSLFFFFGLEMGCVVADCANFMTRWCEWDVFYMERGSLPAEPCSRGDVSARDTPCWHDGGRVAAVGQVAVL
jgi:hypothetical protein